MIRSTANLAYCAALLAFFGWCAWCLVSLARFMLRPTTKYQRAKAWSGPASGRWKAKLFGTASALFFIGMASGHSAALLLGVPTGLAWDIAVVAGFVFVGAGMHFILAVEGRNDPR